MENSGEVDQTNTTHQQLLVTSNQQTFANLPLVCKSFHHSASARHFRTIHATFNALHCRAQAQLIDRVVKLSRSGYIASLVSELNIDLVALIMRPHEYKTFHQYGNLTAHCQLEDKVILMLRSCLEGFPNLRALNVSSPRTSSSVVVDRAAPRKLRRIVRRAVEDTLT